MSSSISDVRVLVDFDGTIVPGDVTDHIFQCFAGPKWLDLEAEFQSGRMSSRDCMGAQVELIRASREDIRRAVSERDIDPAFPEFVDVCRDRGIAVTVVSDGFDLAIDATLERYGLDLPYYANHLAWQGNDRWRLEFPHRNIDCTTGAGNCKCRQLAPLPQRTVVIGDGRSDFCAASSADFVLSKASLTKHCISNGIRHWAFTDFTDVMNRMDGWLFEAHHTSATKRAGTARARQSAPTRHPIPAVAEVGPALTG